MIVSVIYRREIGSLLARLGADAEPVRIKEEPEPESSRLKMHSHEQEILPQMVRDLVVENRPHGLPLSEIATRLGYSPVHVEDAARNHVELLVPAFAPTFSGNVVLKSDVEYLETERHIRKCGSPAKWSLVAELARRHGFSEVADQCALDLAYFYIGVHDNKTALRALESWGSQDNEKIQELKEIIVAADKKLDSLADRP